MTNILELIFIAIGITIIPLIKHYATHLDEKINLINRRIDKIDEEIEILSKNIYSNKEKIDKINNSWMYNLEIANLKFSKLVCDVADLEGYLQKSGYIPRKRAKDDYIIAKHK
jgi:vacuolar-type H+-ATPase subunit I/STV1